MCDEFVCSDSGVVSLCDDDRKLLASLGAKKPQQIHAGEEREAELTDNNNVESETNRNLNTSTKTDQQGIRGVTLRSRAIHNSDTFIPSYHLELQLDCLNLHLSPQSFYKRSVNVLMDSGYKHYVSTSILKH